MPPALPRGGAASLAAANRSPKTDVPRWVQVDPDALRWDQSYPYQLLCVRREPGGAWRQDDAWQFTLPIAPQSLAIDMVPPTELVINQDGAVEVVDEVRLRNIQAACTMGMLPGRPAAAGVPFSAARTIFAGTVARSAGVATTALAVGRDLFPREFLPAHILRDADFAGEVGRSSGYYQYLLLEQFLERYFSAKKKDPELQLALAVWKVQRVYLVRLSSFALRRGVPRVHHWDYSFSAESWRAVSLDRSPPAYRNSRPLSTDPSRLAAAIQAVRDSRRVLAQSRALISAAVGDVVNLVTEPLREVSLLLADSAGTSATLADLPRDVIRGARDAVLSLLSARGAVSAVPQSVLDRLAAAGPEVDELRELGAQLGRSDTRLGTLSISGALRNSPALDIFDHPEAHHDFWSAIRPGDLQLPPAVTTAIAQERSRVRQLGRAALEERRGRIRSAADQLARRAGASSPTYELLSGRRGPAAQPEREPTDTDYEALFALGQAAQVLDSLAAHASPSSSATERAVRYQAGLASAAGVPFQVPRSKRQVPFPYGETLEQLARTYLGDPDRWHEVAALNQLRPPYVDEAGYRCYLVAAGWGSSVVLDGAAAGLLPGQEVELLSTTARAVQATVLDTRPHGATWLVTLDRPAQAYRPQDGAYVHAYLAGTVHGGAPLWIPDDGEPAAEDFGARDPAAQGVDVLLRGSGTDLLQTPDGDLVVTPDGDFRYARGLALVTQVVREVVATPRGSKLRHPSFGFPELVGESVADVSARDVTAATKEAFADDPLFRGVEQVATSMNGGKVRVGVSLDVWGLDRPLPLSVELR